MKGLYKGQAVPRILHLSIARYERELPGDDEPLEFLVSIHEEGAGTTWQENVTIGLEAERSLADKVQRLYLWAAREPGGPIDAAEVRETVRRLGAELFDYFIGARGGAVLERTEAIAFLLDVDETIMDLPWELMGPKGSSFSQHVPFGRLVTTRLEPPKVRDLAEEDDRLRILAVINPTPDLGPGERQASVLHELAGARDGYKVEVDVIPGKEASIERFRETIASNDYDIVHFTGHGSFDSSRPGASSLRFSDGELTADEVLDLRWGKPPYMVFNSACESGRAAGGRRLVSEEGEGNGLAAAFMSGGAMAYAGFYWPASIIGAREFVRMFYQGLVTWENLGIAFKKARQGTALDPFGSEGDLTGLNAVLYGDAASSHRPDIYRGCAPPPRG